MEGTIIKITCQAEYIFIKLILIRTVSEETYFSEIKEEKGRFLNP